MTDLNDKLAGLRLVAGINTVTREWWWDAHTHGSKREAP